jgi:hypothetical protein
MLIQTKIRKKTPKSRKKEKTADLLQAKYHCSQKVVNFSSIINYSIIHY